MKAENRCFPFGFRRILWATTVCAVVASCTEESSSNGLDAPGFDPKGEAEDNITVGNRLMAAGEYELALESFSRAALDQGMTTQVLTSLGTANLGLRRVGQAETLLRRAVENEPDWPVAWNNLGVLLMEKQEYPEAAQVFQRAFALDNGESDAIRDNLRLALAKMENPVNTTTQEQEYTLEQRGDGQFTLRKIQ
ncbi:MULTISPECIES: tetratricopeptide repeat protein [unclassified Ruegeria]|uniref:tetratricopeptide repeat protein n=2 Tax=Ruegeria TaxID=97050 RepID=UPI0014896D13|nr:MULTISPECIES: tetratricopeptide repeat protein [unclassified Ruegeria]NOD35195.1 tetratricopeptide repeat protein [Ruegeria sp. HKCCD7296]NOD46839.1 tetratricopeptide repeat protein [Ruegeria sp. HKCCD5849]NOD51162.1 tetratricopeptide repeat protein [Ruegeria sp. HKCCD5851]NOD67981.1 tetratricopeptide repeat protein [Ruegeria sp. HKCCD7303]NOE33595.1 tetratricopeptide repeat protein [Ruegeria sp. HKCCD7318]